MPLHSTRPAPTESNTDFLRRYARIMLRASHSDQTSKALPIVRRVHAAQAAPGARLTDLYRERATLQLKHMFRTLAAELGYANWDACKRDVDRRPAAMLDRFRLDLGAFGDYQHVWFADAPTASAWQRQHGGRMVVYGAQAVVMAT